MVGLLDEWMLDDWMNEFPSFGGVAQRSCDGVVLNVKRKTLRRETLEETPSVIASLAVSYFRKSAIKPSLSNEAITPRSK